MAAFQVGRNDLGWGGLFLMNKASKRYRTLCFIRMIIVSYYSRSDESFMQCTGHQKFPTSHLTISAPRDAIQLVSEFQ